MWDVDVARETCPRFVSAYCIIVIVDVVAFVHETRQAGVIFFVNVMVWYGLLCFVMVWYGIVQYGMA